MAAETHSRPPEKGPSGSVSGEGGCPPRDHGGGPHPRSLCSGTFWTVFTDTKMTF